MQQSQLLHRSKLLAYILRHSTMVDNFGWISIDVLCKQYGYTIVELETIVANDNKGRFLFSDDKMAVRALYGHSIKIELNLSPATPPAVLYHGTAEKSLASIFEEGIKPMSRVKVHLSPTYGMAYFVGGRHGMPEVLEINSAAIAADGYVFYKITNDVWQTDYIPAKYITGIPDLPTAVE